MEVQNSTSTTQSTRVATDNDADAKLFVKCQADGDGGCGGEEAKGEAKGGEGGNREVAGYRKIRDLGVGSFGKAILVERISTGEKCVMKAVEITRLSSKQREQSINEVRLLGSIKHPFVIAYQESFLVDGFLCIITDYAPGGDLYTAICRQREAGGYFSERKIIRWIVQCALALKHLHARHILHRDVKTQNIFLKESLKICLGDFGIAKVLENTTSFTQTLIGTPYYLSPEICKSQPYSWSSDIWALGCVLYELCALKVPFDAPNLKTLACHIVNARPPPLPPRYSPELRVLYAKMLGKNAAQRPTAAQLLQEPILQRECQAFLHSIRATASRPTKLPPSLSKASLKISDQENRATVNLGNSPSQKSQAYSSLTPSTRDFVTWEEQRLVPSSSSFSSSMIALPLPNSRATPAIADSQKEGTLERSLEGALAGFISEGGSPSNEEGRRSGRGDILSRRNRPRLGLRRKRIVAMSSVFYPNRSGAPPTQTQSSYKNRGPAHGLRQRSGRRLSERLRLRLRWRQRSVENGGRQRRLQKLRNRVMRGVRVCRETLLAACARISSLIKRRLDGSGERRKGGRFERATGCDEACGPSCDRRGNGAGQSRGRPAVRAHRPF